jgi:raffinose synthase
MTIGAGIAVQNGDLVVLGTKILSYVHDNIILTPASGTGITNGSFLGVKSKSSGSHNVFPIGKLQ